MPTASVRVTLAGAFLLGCSSSESLPPNLVCDSGCEPQIPAAAFGPTPADAGAGACASSSGDSTCVQCAKASCCADFSLCAESTECTSLSACEANCNDSACVAGCEQEFPTGVATLEQLDSCLGTECLSCTELGVGDPCATALGSCETGLTCNGLWCVKACTTSTNCVGLGASGANALGEQSACVGTATNGDVCFPGCAVSASHCASFPGTACFSTTSVDGVTVAICESVPDAGTD
ncbi:MAG TPA: hypothetical protein VEK07_02745 [Polyangiaceae bacterium]|nr:hypothetical protein [Polyangiaceae bacterium]